MRLIDADRLKEKMATTLEVLKHIFPPGEQEVHLISAFATVGEMADDCPTIDAVPVKHGEWVDDGGVYRCSSCNHLWSELWWTNSCPIERMLKIMPYCPNCGAKMEGGKDE